LNPLKPSPSLAIAHANARFGEPLIQPTALSHVASPSGYEKSPDLTIDGIEDEIVDFRRFLFLKKNLTKKVVDFHCNTIRKFLRSYQGLISEDTVGDYLSRVKARWKPKTYCNHLGSFKRYVRDYKVLKYVDDYEFPSVTLEPVTVPSREELVDFFEVLPDTKRTSKNEWKPLPRYKALFLLLASSGLRLGEAVSLRIEDVSFDDRMIIPKSRTTSTTKKSWVSFYNREAEEYLYWVDELLPDDRIFPHVTRVHEVFKSTADISGTSLTAQSLRRWFCEEMGNLGVSDRYIDAFCGRLPYSVLSRRYTDYSPSKLKAVYERANLKVLQ